MQLPTLTNISPKFKTQVNARAKRLSIGDLTIWFCDARPVAFMHTSLPYPIVKKQETWNIVAYKVLIAIDGGDKDMRLPEASFNAKLSKLLRIIMPDV